VKQRGQLALPQFRQLWCACKYVSLQAQALRARALARALRAGAVLTVRLAGRCWPCTSTPRPIGRLIPAAGAASLAVDPHSACRRHSRPVIACPCVVRSGCCWLQSCHRSLAAVSSSGAHVEWPRTRVLCSAPVSCCPARAFGLRVTATGLVDLEVLHVRGMRTHCELSTGARRRITVIDAAEQSAGHANLTSTAVVSESRRSPAATVKAQPTLTIAQMHRGSRRRTFRNCKTHAPPARSGASSGSSQFVASVAQPLVSAGLLTREHSVRDHSMAPPEYALRLRPLYHDDSCMSHRSVVADSCRMAFELTRARCLVAPSDT